MKRYYATWYKHEWVVKDRIDGNVVKAFGKVPVISRVDAIDYAEQLNSRI